MLIKIGVHDWKQVGGDMDPGGHGGIIARADGDAIEIREIQPTREYVGDAEAAEMGFPFWTRDGYFDMSDLDPTRDETKKAMQYLGLEDEMLAEMEPEVRAMALAEALLMYGMGDEGPAGWAKDVVPGKVLWWGNKRPQGWRYLADEDRDFRQMLRERKRED